MKTYQRRKGVIAWQYDTEENFWEWIKEAKFTRNIKYHFAFTEPVTVIKNYYSHEILEEV